MKRIVLLLLFAVALLCSCEIFECDERDGKLNIIAIVINYAGADYSINPLSKTIADAIEASKAFVALCIEYEKSVGYQRFLISDRALSADYSAAPDFISANSLPSTKANFDSCVDELALQAQDNDLTLIFYSGHGSQTSSNPSRNNLEYLQNTGSETSFAFWDKSTGTEFYSHRDFLDKISTIKGRVLLIADSCYSGGLVCDNGISISASTYSATSIPSWEALLFDYPVIVNPRLYVMTAARSYEVSYESYDTGLFTGALLDALGWNQETQQLENAIPSRMGDRISFSSIYQCIRNSEAIRRSGYSQKVTASASSLDLVLFD